MKPVNVAVVGATGAVGEVMIEILESRGFPVNTLYPLASSRSAGKSVQFRGKHHTVQDLSTFDFSDADWIVLGWRRYQRRVCADCGLSRMRCDRQHFSFSPR